MSHRPGAFHLGGLVTTTTAFSAAKRVTKKLPGIVNTISNTFDAYQKETDWSGNLTSRISVRCVLGPKTESMPFSFEAFSSGGTEVGRSLSSLARQESGPLLASFLFALLLFTSLSIIRGEGIR
jgi:hypothetical protein